MAFTDAQKAQIRQVLGYSELFHDVDTRLESQMDEIGTRSPDAETRVKSSLTAITALDTRISTALDNLDVRKAGSIELLGPAQLETLRQHGRMLIQQIAITFEVEIKRDYYGDGTALAAPVLLG